MRYLFISYVAYNMLQGTSYGNTSLECSDFPSMGKMVSIISERLNLKFKPNEIIVMNIVELTSYDYHKLCAKSPE